MWSTQNKLQKAKPDDASRKMATYSAGASVVIIGFKLSFFRFFAIAAAIAAAELPFEAPAPKGDGLYPADSPSCCVPFMVCYRLTEYVQK